MMKVKGLRWWIISLIAIATIINYIDRSAINILWPYIYKDFGIADADSKNALALITTFFMIAYALGQTVFGKIMDSLGTKLGFVLSIVIWSIAIALHSFAKSLSSFSFFRFLLGFGESGNWPGATKSNAEWFPAKERAIAQGIFGAGASLGSVVAAPFIAILYLSIGWQGTFVAIAALGLLWIIPWLIINKSTPDKHPWITKEEQTHILDSQINDSNNTSTIKVFSWKELIQLRKTWGIILSRFFIDPVWWLFVTWLPTFLKEQFSFDLKQVGAFAWMPYLLAAIGGLVGGYFSSYLIRKGKDAAKARILAITIGSIIMLISLSVTAFLLDSLKNEPSLAIGLIGATLFGFQFIINNIQTLPSDYFNGKNVGVVSGMGGTAAILGVIITTWMVPVLTKTSYVSFFVLAALLVPASMAALYFFSNNNTIKTSK
jgi:ACS family hexuronate transporter-like MFS transporter